MKVLIDDGLSTLQQVGGIYNHSINLWKHLRASIDCDITDYHYLSGFPRVIKRAVYLGHANLKPQFGEYDIIHYQNYYVPPFLGKAKGVVTIHDLAGLKFPELYPSWYNAYFRRTLRQAVRRSDAIILDSHAIKEQILTSFRDLDESRTHVCHIGTKSIFFESHPTDERLARMNLRPHSYFLCVGNLETRKNLPLLFSQFVTARKRFLIAPETKLVLVGQGGIGFKGFQHLMSERDQIIHLGRLSDEELIVLYKYCKAFVFPSLYEGFGIPIVEAMSQRVPILISNIPPSLELDRRHNHQCFVFEIGRDETLVEMLSHLDKNFAEIASGLNYGDLSVYSYDNVAREHIQAYTKILRSES